MSIQWYRVAIHMIEIDSATASASAVIDFLGAAYRSVGAPDVVQVYHRRLGPTDHLSPAAASL
jgi:hypothetical protein